MRLHLEPSPITMPGRLAGDLAVGFGATIPLNTETEWDEVKHTWAVDRHGRPAKDRYGVGADHVNDNNEDQLRIIRTLLLIRQPADARRALWQAEQVRPDAAARKRLRRPVPSTPMPRSATSRSASPSTPHPTTTAVPATPPAASTATSGSYGRTYPDHDDPTGYSRKWVGPCLVTPEGCEDAPILGRERVVSVLRR
ncbi:MULTISPECIES: hypothetical protein [unclassified Streptomyces]|uniref:hypothetical protein n=2 Tax=Streptomyces TaxID=1883 RepID=UPI001368C2E1|nr:hypothetical protein [Streptomyces sp. SID4936]MYQ82399.1 hypothetical protein [Streptomyces sp. SID4936]